MPTFSAKDAWPEYEKALREMHVKTISSEMDVLARALKAIINHWDEFGPEYGMDECIDNARRVLASVQGG